MTPSNEEDQRGFRIFDWYLAISRSVLSHTCPVLVLAAGSALDPQHVPAPVVSPVIQAQTALNIARLLAGESVPNADVPNSNLDAVPDGVLSCSFWLLTAAPASPALPQAWFQPDGQTLPVVGTFRQWVTGKFGAQMEAAKVSQKGAGFHERPTIDHYLLLPTYDWGVADYHLDIIKPFVKKHHPTVGFSLTEAEHARQVTVIGGIQVFPDEAINHLRSVGCYVERINGDGTQIATILAER
jgi:hypothetical protein